MDPAGRRSAAGPVLRPRRCPSPSAQGGGGGRGSVGAGASVHAEGAATGQGRGGHRGAEHHGGHVADGRVGDGGRGGGRPSPSAAVHSLLVQVSQWRSMKAILLAVAKFMVQSMSSAFRRSDQLRLPPCGSITSPFMQISHGRDPSFGEGRLWERDSSSLPS